jgi:RNA polymerase sigma-70 factor (ECF subfamily)
MDEPSAELMTRWREGDQRAAEALVERYTERLLALARSRMSTPLARHIDPEDVLQSAYRSFFVGTRDGRYVLQRSGDLWRLLAAITLHKLHHQVERHTAQKRTSTRTQSLDAKGSLYGLQAAQLNHEPSPAEAAALADELEQVLRGLSTRERRMVEMRLQGYSLDEIATTTQRCERTVRRILEKVKERLEQQCRECSGD